MHRLCEVDDKEDSTSGHVEKYSLTVFLLQMLTYSLQWNVYTAIFSSYHYAHKPLKYVYNMPFVMHIPNLWHAKILLWHWFNTPYTGQIIEQQILNKPNYVEIVRYDTHLVFTA